MFEGPPLAVSYGRAEVVGRGSIQQVWRAGFVGGADALPDWDRASIRADVDAKRGSPP